ncbi:RsmB/NOP family class I SAM-dependent RNA methyltransferase [Croceicoccus hydrothermalis]|uniref:RsmB/NOP family class I SAM-dependent RNA methyltransferase n=1 Tax=Croceicoccus hydrothermalis TaxID=2867964 RepID=UPI001EFB233F|nr:methyltransferase domain-containing protein [Croceicoccus hydrothermalis]
MTDTTGLPARRAALRMLDAVFRRGETLDNAAFSATRNLRNADAGLALAIAAEVLRWTADLDAAIDSATRQPLPEDAKARMVLRMMLAQAWRLDSAPHAVIATGLPLLEGGPRRLAHGVFSALLKGEGRLPESPTLPERVRARWTAAWPDRVGAIGAALSEPPPLDLTLAAADDTQIWAERLDAAVLAPGRLRLARGQAVETLPGYGDGAWWVQDFAASLPAHLLGAGEGRRVLDLCAAPGGKTMQLAANGWQVTALDISDRRLKRLERNLARTGLGADVVKANALDWEPDARFDAILLDAPCSATGTCRRHPDVLHRVGANQIADLAELQAALLTRATGWLKPAGRMIYAVCSLEPEEGEAQAHASTLPTDAIAPGELPAGLRPTAEGWLRTDPGMMAGTGAMGGGMDGFFIARFAAP